MKITSKISSLLLISAFLLFGYSKAYSEPPSDGDSNFVKGADIGWLPQVTNFIMIKVMNRIVSGF